jgi:hypothetical protein
VSPRDEFDTLNDPLVGVTLLLADSAQVADGKLYVLGGGLNEIGPGAQPLAIAMLIEVPWDRTDIRHDWRFELLDEDGTPVLYDDQPIQVTGQFEVTRPDGLAPGTPLNVPMAINFAALPVAPGTGYVWRLSVDDTGEPDWVLPFRVRAAA